MTPMSADGPAGSTTVTAGRMMLTVFGTSSVTSNVIVSPPALRKPILNFPCSVRIRGSSGMSARKRMVAAPSLIRERSA